MITEGLGAVTAVLAESRGTHWNVPPEKLAKVGAAYGRVIDHYFPAESIGEATLIGGALFATAAAFGPPITIDLMRANLAKAAAATAYNNHADRRPPTAPTATPPTWEPPASPPSPGGLPNLSEEEMNAAAAEAMQILQGLFAANGGTPTP